MGDDIMNKEFSNTPQRYAVCLNKWEDKKKNVSAVIRNGNDEIIYFMEEI
jgi:hypothetical protein